MITLNNFTFSYQQHPALHHISGRFERGSLTAVIGPNGSGKSTLLKSLAGVLPQQHKRHARSLQWTAPYPRLAYLPQRSELDRAFPITVQDCVLLGAWGRMGGFSGAFSGVDSGTLAQVTHALHTVGLQGLERRTLGTLSSGQLQRVLFARLLVQDADLILLDEPFNGVDSKTTTSLLAVIAKWHQQQRTVIAVLHDDAQVRQHFPNTLLLAREMVAWGPTHEVLTEAHLARSRAMAQAWDEDAALCERAP